MAKNKYGEYGEYGDPPVASPPGGEGSGGDAPRREVASEGAGTTIAEPGAAIVGGGLTLVATVAAACVWGVMLLWLIGEVVSDRLFVTQFLEWMPTKLVIVGAAVGLITARIFLTLGSVMRTPGAWVKRMVGGGWIALALLLGYYVFVESPMFKSRPAAPGLQDDAFRVVFWNMSAGIGTTKDKDGHVVSDGSLWVPNVAGESGDIVVLTSAVGGSDLASVAGTMKSDTFTVAPASPFTVLSKRPISRWGVTRLNLSAGEGWNPRQDFKQRYVDPGHAMFFQVQCAGKGTTPAGDIVVWVLDLPSDMSLSRWKVTREARDAIDGFRGEVYVPGPDGRWEIGEKATDAARGFPKPDLIVGDFNIPRGSASLKILDERLPSAYRQAGKGDMSSFPRLPLVHIDQTFVAPSLRAWRYAVKPVGVAPHRMQVVDLVREGAK